MDQEELQYDEGVDAGEGGDDSFVGGGDDDHQLNDTDQSIETELEVIKARVREMEEEAEKIRQIQSEVDKQMNLGSPPGAAGATSPLNMSLEEKMEVDARSIYVGNVDYGATAEELEQHFHGCGAVNRVTILCNKYDGHPKGFAYIEFSEKDSVQMAMALDESLFRGRQLKPPPPLLCSSLDPPLPPRRQEARHLGFSPTSSSLLCFFPYLTSPHSFLLLPNLQSSNPCFLPDARENNLPPRPYSSSTSLLLLPPLPSFLSFASPRSLRLLQEPEVRPATLPPTGTLVVLPASLPPPFSFASQSLLPPPLPFAYLPYPPPSLLCLLAAALTLLLPPPCGLCPSERTSLASVQVTGPHEEACLDGVVDGFIQVTDPCDDRAGDGDSTTALINGCVWR
ncbi:hypothetical protein C7M84_023925 [Penaeus vannamei]|uniref:RRM domain-containing protein n=1 Tax=Penaeus vannamei TaxID=6689 RepID=A0A3R7MIW3_PENVA|nr:hypothetical protein C7M84_023925 [Penaeus vannamei]